jgi:hypothetical protein
MIMDTVSNKGYYVDLVARSSALRPDRVLSGYWAGLSSCGYGRPEGRGASGLHGVPVLIKSISSQHTEG